MRAIDGCFEIHVELIRIPLMRRNGFLADLADRKGFHIVRHIALGDLFHVQQVVDERKQAISVVASDLQQVPGLNRYVAERAAREKADLSE